MGDRPGTVLEVAPDVFCVRDTCNVYLLRKGASAVTVDFGSGAVLDHLDDLGVTELTDVLMTHHHRDQGQGLARATSAGARIWVPPVERDLFAAVDQHWQARPLDNDYDLGQDRFSLLDPVEVAGDVQEYKKRAYGPWEVLTVPTPGHTVGSVSYLIEVDGRLLAFVGDLLYGQGKVWSLASMQWTYIGLEGAGMTIASLRSIGALEPQLLLPAHGGPVPEPASAIESVAGRLQELLDHRPLSQAAHIEARELGAHLGRPYERVSEHLLMNRTSRAISYALLSKDGAALILDYGYDVCAGIASSPYRSARRPWLASLPTLHRDFGVDRIEVVMPTHYHDDHVAGFNLLRDVEGAEVWAGANVAEVLVSPTRFDLPCLWYDAIPVDRVIPLGRPVRWREYELTLYELGGHTLYAVAISFEVDGRKVVATGDQQDGAWVPGERQEYLNYQYRNGFRVDDFVASANLYRRLGPDVIISGHWSPRTVTPAYLDHLLEEGEHVARLHRELLPLEEFDFGSGGFGAKIEPYRSAVNRGGTVTLIATLQNPFPRSAEVVGAAVAPAGWRCDPPSQAIVVGPHRSARFEFTVHTNAIAARRARVAVDLTVDGVRFGQQAEALIDVT